MDEESTPPTHFTWLLGLEIERAWPLGGFVHNIDAGRQFVGGGWEGTCIHNALVVRI